MTATYTKLRDDTWGLKSTDPVKPGDRVDVTKRNGEVKTEIAGELIYAFTPEDGGPRTFTHRIQAQAAPSAAKIGDMAPILGLFRKAQKHLKRPAIVLGIPSIAKEFAVRINVAGNRAKVPGSLTVLDANKDEGSGDRDWFGRILLDGTYQPSRSATGMQDRITARLREFAADPVKVAGEHGRLTGKCCFCNRALTDERSTGVGYGETCADHYGMPWGKRPGAFGEAAGEKPAGAFLQPLSEHVAAPGNRWTVSKRGDALVAFHPTEAPDKGFAIIAKGGDIQLGRAEGGAFTMTHHLQVDDAISVVRERLGVS